jgi:REP element-mobilizing transposase RayT
METKQRPDYKQFSRDLRETIYSRDGHYFVTIAAKDEKDHFSDIIDGRVNLTVAGRYVEKQLHWLTEQYSYVRLDSYIIMPNHVHCILLLQYGSSHISLQQQRKRSLTELIELFKSTSERLIHLFARRDFGWQRRSFEHYIRNKRTLQDLRIFIKNNPRYWGLDKNNRMDLFM